jgi:hypothetical protein
MFAGQTVTFYHVLQKEWEKRELVLTAWLSSQLGYGIIPIAQGTSYTIEVVKKDKPTPLNRRKDTCLIICTCSLNKIQK